MEFQPLPKPRSGNFVDLTGSKYTRLTVIGYAGGDGKHSYWWCRCDCGAELKTSANKLRKNHTRSCGCLKIDAIRAATTTHGMTRGPLYGVWAKMRSRCLRPNDPAYAYYGGRGIRICQRWIAGDGELTGFEAFLADIGPKPSALHTLDRTDNDGHYEPGNCRWATKKEQARNRRSNRLVAVGNRTCSVAEACETLGLPHNLVNSRIQNGWSPERAISEPFRKGRYAHPSS